MIFKKNIRRYLKYFLIIITLLLIRNYVLISALVVGKSMEPNYIDGNIMIVEQVSQYVKKHNRFDIVVFKYDNSTYIIKRIIGLPGEFVKYKNNMLYINNTYVEEVFDVSGYTEDFEVIVPIDKYFVLGDNRTKSRDSRIFGSIQKKDIIGKPLIVIWPIKTFVNAN